MILPAVYVIACSYRLVAESGPACHGELKSGVAICSDPDTPLFILDEEGNRVPDEPLYNYTLWHHCPWAKVDFAQLSNTLKDRG